MAVQTFPTPLVQQIKLPDAMRLLGIDPSAKRFAVTDAEFEKELRARREHALVHPPALPAVHGPRTRRELLAFLARRGGRP